MPNNVFALLGVRGRPSGEVQPAEKARQKTSGEPFHSFVERASQLSEATGTSSLNGLTNVPDSTSNPSPENESGAGVFEVVASAGGSAVRLKSAAADSLSRSFDSLSMEDSINGVSTWNLEALNVLVAPLHPEISTHLEGAESCGATVCESESSATPADANELSSPQTDANLAATMLNQRMVDRESATPPPDDDSSFEIDVRPDSGTEFENTFLASQSSGYVISPSVDIADSVGTSSFGQQIEGIAAAQSFGAAADRVGTSKSSADSNAATYVDGVATGDRSNPTPIDSVDGNQSAESQHRAKILNSSLDDSIQSSPLQSPLPRDGDVTETETIAAETPQTDFGIQNAVAVANALNAKQAAGSTFSANSLQTQSSGKARVAGESNNVIGTRGAREEQNAIRNEGDHDSTLSTLDTSTLDAELAFDQLDPEQISVEQGFMSPYSNRADAANRYQSVASQEYDESLFSDDDASAVSMDLLAGQAQAEITNSVAEEVLALEEFLHANTPFEALQRTGEVIRDAAESSLKFDGKTVQIDLHPAELGALQVSVTETDGVIETQIIASEFGTSELLNNQREQLIDVLKQLGYESTHIDISYRDQSSSESPHRQRSSEYAYQSKTKSRPMSRPTPASMGGVNIVA